MISYAIKAACAAIVTGLLLGTILLTLDRPLGAEITAGDDHQCEQSEDFTCADAALVSAFSWVGKTVTERQMVIACGTDRRGTTMIAVAKVAHSVVQPVLMAAPGKTFVVEISDWPRFHAICAHGEADGWTVNDPALNHPQHWTAADFATAVCAVEVKP